MQCVLCSALLPPWNILDRLPEQLPTQSLHDELPCSQPECWWEVSCLCLNLSPKPSPYSTHWTPELVLSHLLGSSSQVPPNPGTSYNPSLNRLPMLCAPPLCGSPPGGRGSGAPRPPDPPSTLCDTLAVGRNVPRQQAAFHCFVSPAEEWCGQARTRRHCLWCWIPG